MCALSCPHCHEDIEVFPPVGDPRSIWTTGVEKLIELPFDPAVARIAEENRPLLVADPQGAQATRFRRLGEAVAAAVAGD